MSEDQVKYQEKRKLQWLEIQPIIIEYGHLFLYNEDVQKNKNIPDKIKQLTQMEVNDHEIVLKLMLEVE